MDPSLNKGEFKVETPGQAGQKTTTVTVENSKVVGRPNVVVTKEPVTEVIKVGDKDFTGQVSHTEHFETAFKVIVRRSDALKPGQVKTVQEGVKGAYDVTFTQKIKNGQADGPLQADRHNEVAAVDHIIEVGPDCPICPLPENPDQPGQDKPNEDKPGNDTPGGHTPDGEKPDKPGSGGNTPGDGNPEDPKPNDKTPGQGTSDHDTPDGSTSNEGVPAKDKSDGNTPEDPKSGQETPGDKIARDKRPSHDQDTDPASAKLSPVSHKASAVPATESVQVTSSLPQTGALASVSGLGLSLLLAGLGCLSLDRKKKA
ncbi:G5 domain-containing protein [Aerococcus sp. Group 1]|uniref:G5 domain-containing protein n=1 Tax=Aerococcus urinae (strain CCUG 59500 / ACS-120-V-Col10a) TaxID=2976812 RepID=UPI00227D3667|nr:G5 domain-containing protein [Aerococcus sp. Group 1]MCY3030318.1 G5 domain-containing protein [Aerococcus sp. Group 1]